MCRKKICSDDSSPESYRYFFVRPENSTSDNSSPGYFVYEVFPEILCQKILPTKNYPTKNFPNEEVSGEKLSKRRILRRRISREKTREEYPAKNVPRTI
jgi:hypothetical protein